MLAIKINLRQGAALINMKQNSQISRPDPINHKLFFISHTHWDREWFLPARYTCEWLISFFDSLLDLLDKEPEYRFVLDGQTIMIEDYLEELKRLGENPGKAKERLARYCREGRITGGPYYLQPDWQLAGGEALIRNLLIGFKDAGDLGSPMRAGWLLDNFGQISQAPQIHAGFGIKGLFLWRGVEMEPQKVRTEFLWSSPDGTVLPCIYLLDSYRNGMRLLSEREILSKRVEKIANRLTPFSETPNLLLMNGYDQETEPENILPVLKELRKNGFQAKQILPEDYLRIVLADKPSLQTLAGTLYSGRYISVFPGVLSSRMYLKLQNHLCQNLLERYTEPLCTLAWLKGADYPSEELTLLWRNLLKNHPHDNICGVSVDEVHEDMERRFSEVKGECSQIIGNALKLLTAGRREVDKEFLVFNPSLHPRTGIVIFDLSEKGSSADSAGESLVPVDERGEILPFSKDKTGALHVFIPETPPLGFRSVRFVEPSTSVSAGGTLPEKISVSKKERRIDSPWHTLFIKDDGTIDLVDKERGFTYTGLFMFEDSGDAGDTYNYSPPLSDILYSSAGGKAGFELLSEGPLLATVKITTELVLPEALSPDRERRSPQTTILPVITFITVSADSPLIRFTVILRNTVKDHRLRVIFPTDIRTEISIAETQFDVVSHPIIPEPYKDDEIPPELKKILLGAREPEPVTTFPQTRFVDLSDGRRGLAVINRGLPEYEILPERSTIALTLFRSVGWLARGDLKGRVGDAGPAIYTPGAQCLRDMVFRFALYPHTGNWEGGEVGRLAEEFNTPLLVIEPAGGYLAGIRSRSKRAEEEDYPHGFASPEGFLRVLSPGNVIRESAVKITEDGEAVLIRLFNPSPCSIPATLHSALRIKRAWMANLNEGKEYRVYPVDGNTLTVSLGAKKIATVLLDIERGDTFGTDNARTKYGKAGASAKTLEGCGFRLLEYVSPAALNAARNLFSRYVSQPAVTEEDLIIERKRAEKLAAELKKLEETEAKTKDTHTKELRLWEKRSRLSTLKRELLETKLSVLYLERKLHHLDRERASKSRQKELDRVLRETGFKLNLARIRKRTDDYLLAFFKE
ncbi:MAG: hypothetical protein DRP87_00450 [Spirochaetes bacterium]|nr:MAG: hypothetical protein DRP87_00450 [Spirochaetota bacterium]